MPTFTVVINGPLKQARIEFDSREAAAKFAKPISAAGFIVTIETEAQAERATACLCKPQPRTPQVDGWDV